MIDRGSSCRAGDSHGEDRSIGVCPVLTATHELAVTGVLDGVGLGAASCHGLWPGREVAR